MTLARLRLKKNADRRIKAGHLWIYSNEVDTAATPLKGLQPGQQCGIEHASGQVLGVAYVHPNNLICARMVSEKPDQQLDVELLKARIRQALALRETFYDRPFYRLVYGESDLLPGLIVDRFGDVLAVQLNTAGMDVLKDEVLLALREVLQPVAVVWRNDASARQQEGLESYVALAWGELPDQVLAEENTCSFEVPILDGQKTGWFYDHRPNRTALMPLVKGKRVLDVFSYRGGWGIPLAKSGAAKVVCLDSSTPALEGVMDNARLNGVEASVSTLCADAFEGLQQLQQAGERFDLIILDPPAFIKRKKDQGPGEHAYSRLNREAMKLLADDALLMSGSCSMHLAEDRLQDLVRIAARKQGRSAQLVWRGGQGADHPVHPAIAETRYLKALLFRLVSNTEA